MRTAQPSRRPVGHTRAVALIVTLAVAVLSVWAAQASAGPATPPADSVTTAAGVRAKLVVSPNWSGYVARAPVKPTYGHPYFTSVTGTWTVPRATCHVPKGSKASPKASSTVWVGLGGYSTRNQEEVGTNSNCTAKGKPVYFAWFELVPYLSYQTFPNIKYKVFAGDTVTGAVTVVSPTLVALTVRDHTRHWTFTRKITFSSQDTSTADWVVEAPATCVQYTCSQANLANFGAVNIRNISAVAKGTKGTLTDQRWKVVPVKLVPGKLIVPTISPTATAAGPGGKRGKASSPAGSTPSPVSRDGSSFTMKWVPVASKGL
jgi:Peptidase A4 family